ncbi:MAG: cytochrome c, partial [Planctomycetaceae bacterium]|nr:cytochrome c [Planctomycetaceae bacterium]
NVSFKDQPAGGEQPPAEQPDNTPWVSEFPIEVNEANMLRGQERYRIYCSVCHGLGGESDGLVTLQAQQLGASTWVTPVQLSSENVVKQPVGKLFNTVTNGIRKMPGYASQIPVEDRWAIVLYVRALQKSRTATKDQIPADVLQHLEQGTPAEASKPE